MSDPVFPPKPQVVLASSVQKAYEELGNTSKQLEQARHGLSLERAARKSTNPELSQARREALEIRLAHDEEKGYH